MAEQVLVVYGEPNAPIFNANFICLLYLEGLIKAFLSRVLSDFAELICSLKKKGLLVYD